MERTWKPTTAGILMLINGAALLILGIWVAVIGEYAGMMAGYWGWGAVAGGPAIVLGVVSIIGGIFALRRRAWGMALAGAICALLPIFIMGLLAIIFVSIGKNEFVER